MLSDLRKFISIIWIESKCCITFASILVVFFPNREKH